jgi:hypothetical protein
MGRMITPKTPSEVVPRGPGLRYLLDNTDSKIPHVKLGDGALFRSEERGGFPSLKEIVDT